MDGSTQGSRSPRYHQQQRRCTAALLPKMHETSRNTRACANVQTRECPQEEYELLPTMKCKMKSTNGCKVQELFVKCVEAWLANPETPIIPDISTVPIKQPTRAPMTSSGGPGQDCIGWTLGVRGYLSKH